MFLVKHPGEERATMMTVTTSRDWLEEGMAILEDLGAEALTIETLTNRLGVTKGSFYHHFTSYQHIASPIHGDELMYLYREALPLLGVASDIPTPDKA
jgi:AcrR family transcriptional regulator